MLTLTTAAGELIPLSAYKNLSIKHVEDGNDVLTFYVSTSHEQYQYIQNECRVVTDENDWIVKKIDDDKINCYLNFDFLKQRLYVDYKSSTRSLTEVLLSHLPEDWTIEGANASSILRTISLDVATDYDVIQACVSTYKVRFIWWIKQKRLVVVDPEKMQPTGEYLTSELNLTKVSFKGSSVDFATRLYGYGAGNMTCEEAMVDDGNGGTVRYGLPYVEDRSYADKVICAYWKDERYSMPESLYEAMVEKLSEMSWPVFAYKCDVVDLAKQDERYTFLDFSMFKKVSLIDVERHIHVIYQILEYVEWPDSPEKNTVTLSSVPGTITSTLKKIESNAADKVDEKTSGFDQKIMMATAMLTGAFGGHVITNGSEIFIMDTDNPSTATVVWRWGVNGIGKSSTGIDGPYTTALTFDDTFITNVIQAMVIKGSYIEADSIQATAISQSYTDGVLNQAYEVAEGLVKASFDQVNEYLTNEDGTGQLDVINASMAEIRQTIEGLTLDFTETFSGGVNYVINSAGLNETEGWEYEGIVLTLQDDDTKNSTVSNSTFRLSGDTTLRQTIDNIITGSSYFVSVKIKKTSILSASVKVIYNGSSEAVVVSTSDTWGWTEFTCVINSVQSNTIDVVITNSADHLFVTDIMICEGTNPRTWTPAQNEIYTSGTRVDKNGITIYRGTQEKTVITNKEFAGYYNDEEVFSVNKDQTRMKKTYIDGDLTVGDCMFIPYANADDDDYGLNIALLD